MTKASDFPLGMEGIVPANQTRADEKNVTRAALAALIGTMLENYDFVVYGQPRRLSSERSFFLRSHLAPA